MASTSKKIMLTSSDGETFEVEEAVAVESQTIKHMIEVDCADSAIPIPNVTSKILSKVLEYCKKHVDAATAASNSDDELNAWDAGFVEVNREALFELIKAANYLSIKSLFDLTCQTVADMLRETARERGRRRFDYLN